MTHEEYFCMWKDELSVGSEELDNQHRHMIEILNEVYQAYIHGEDKARIGAIIDKLSEYILYHFTMEEVYFELFDFYDKENHMKEHLKFRQKVQEFKMKYKSNNAALTGDIMNFLKNWLSDHIIETDHKYINCFKYNGVK